MAAAMDIWTMVDEVEPLELDDFWALVHESKAIEDRESIARHVALAQLLSLRSFADIARFKRRFTELSGDANNDEVYAVLGGSDDGFHYNISGVIAMGRETYERLLANPKKAKREARRYREFEYGYELYEYAANDAFEEPRRSELGAAALARRERGILEQALGGAGERKPGPRI